MPERFAEAVRKCTEKLKYLMQDPVRIGNDHLKKIVVFVLLMKGGYRRDLFDDCLSKSKWFPAVVDRYFQGRYRNMYDALMEGLVERDIIRIENGSYHANVTR